MSRYNLEDRKGKKYSSNGREEKKSDGAQLFFNGLKNIRARPEKYEQDAGLEDLTPTQTWIPRGTWHPQGHLGLSTPAASHQLYWELVRIPTR